MSRRRCGQLPRIFCSCKGCANGSAISCDQVLVKKSPTLRRIICDDWLSARADMRISAVPRTHVKRSSAMHKEWTCCLFSGRDKLSRRSRRAIIRSPRRRGRVSAISPNETLRNVGAASFRLDVRRPDHPRPLGDVISNQLTEFGGRNRENGTEISIFRLNRRRCQTCVNFSVQSVDDRCSPHSPGPTRSRPGHWEGPASALPRSRPKRGVDRP
jgi:hypothetical protein